MTQQQVTLLATGDCLIIDEPDPDSYFELARPVLSAADVVVGHVEVPFTLQRESLSANHLFDEGAAGVQDTLDGLRAPKLKASRP